MSYSVKPAGRPYIIGGKISKESFVACIDCYERHPGCHSKCEKYLSEKKEYVAKMKAIRAANLAEYDAGKGRVRTEYALKRRGI